MALTYFDNFVDNIYNNPKIDAFESVNAYVDSQWHDSTLLEEVCEETYTGSFKFNKIEVWLNTVSDFTNNIIKNATDFRRLMFKDNRKTIERGRYYKFHKNYWITYEDTTIESPYAEILVRRCNNIAKWIDIETGEIIEQPCVLEYDISATNPKVDKDIITANSSVTLVLQGNEKTHKLKRNQRFVFNGVPYKFVAYNNYMQNNYVDQDVTLLFMDLDFDLEKPTDDMVNNIADRYEYDFKVFIDNAPTQQVNGFNSTLTASVTLNGEPINADIVWSSNKYATINQDGAYTLRGNAGDVAQITARFGSFSQTINIDIVDVVEQNKEIVISPLFTELNEQETVEFDVALYVDGVRQDDVPTYTVGNVSSTHYTLTQSGNTFTLQNLQKSIKPLEISFALGGITKTLSVKLKALY